MDTGKESYRGRPKWVIPGLVLAGGVLILCILLTIYNRLWAGWGDDKQAQAVSNVVQSIERGDSILAAWDLRQYKCPTEAWDGRREYINALQKILDRTGPIEKGRSAPFDLVHPDEVLYGLFATGTARLRGEQRELEKERLAEEFAHAIRGNPTVAQFYRDRLRLGVTIDHALSEQEARQIESRAAEIAEKLEGDIDREGESNSSQ